MTRFYFLLSRVANGLTNSAKTFEEHVAAQGVAIVKEQASKKTAQAAMKSAISFIQQVPLPPALQVQCFAHTVALLTRAQRAIDNQTAELYAKYSAQVNQCFLKNSSFKEAFDKAFVTIMNLSAGKFTTSRHVSVSLCHRCVCFFSGEHRLTTRARRLLNFYLDYLLKGKAKIAEEEKAAQLEVHLPSAGGLVESAGFDSAHAVVTW